VAELHAGRYHQCRHQLQHLHPAALVDALQEFKVQTGIYSAEFGYAIGQINVSIKPSTNEEHGTLRRAIFDENYDFVLQQENHL